jgi:hypothetical protein
LWPWTKTTIRDRTAIFRQVNLGNPHTHHDALEFADGEIVLLTYLMEGQQATVLQLPAAADARTEQWEPASQPTSLSLQEILT